MSSPCPLGGSRDKKINLKLMPQMFQKPLRGFSKNPVGIFGSKGEMAHFPFVSCPTPPPVGLTLERSEEKREARVLVSSTRAGNKTRGGKAKTPTGFLAPMVKRGCVSNNYEFEVKYNCSGLIKFPLIQECVFAVFPALRANGTNGGTFCYETLWVSCPCYCSIVATTSWFP